MYTVTLYCDRTYFTPTKKKLQYFKKTKLDFVKAVENYVEMWIILRNPAIKLTLKPAIISHFFGSRAIDMQILAEK